MTISENLVSKYKMVQAAAPVTSNAQVTCDYISMKNAHKVWIVVSFKQAATHATTVQPQAATGITPAGATSITYSATWWKNADIGTTDTLVAQTAATSGAATAGTNDQMLVFEIDPALQIATHGATFDCLGCVIAASSEVTNFVSVVYVIETRYPQATPPTAITD